MATNQRIADAEAALRVAEAAKRENEAAQAAPDVAVAEAHAALIRAQAQAAEDDFYRILNEGKARLFPAQDDLARELAGALKELRLADALSIAEAMAQNNREWQTAANAALEAIRPRWKIEFNARKAAQPRGEIRDEASFNLEMQNYRASWRGQIPKLTTPPAELQKWASRTRRPGHVVAGVILALSGQMPRQAGLGDVSAMSSPPPLPPERR